ncbi:MAG: transglycosylase domain-containing protein [Mycobacteriales bacterium]
MGRFENVNAKRLVLIGGVGSVLVLVALVGVGYAVTDIPDVNKSAAATTTRILYQDGSELGRVGSENRVPVGINEVPVQVQRAVLAAEDRGFYTEPGISPKGIARALFTNIRGGGSIQQGGSTITQQYAKNAFLSPERSYTRKVKEVFIALKLSRTVEKDQILEDYLNTIYFGRQASGIQVASQTYFGVPVDQLTVAQGAVLAASIRSPATLDPQKHPEDAMARWNSVLDGMVEKGWLTPAERSAQVYPEVLDIGAGPGAANNDLSGPKGHIITAVLEELADRGFPEDRGLVVTTTIRKGAQDAAVAAVQGALGDQTGPDDLQGALVSVQPGTGEVWAYYGGATGTGFDFANQGIGRQPGSSFKPYVLATALDQGKSLDTRLDGNSPKDFPGTAPVDNFGGEDFGSVDLVEATKSSINTAYFELGLQVGPSRIAELAHAAGIPDRAPLRGQDGATNGSIALGSYEVRVIDQAVGFATFANKGVPAPAFVVKTIATAQGDEVYKAKPRPGPAAFGKDVAADATFALQAVVADGTGRGARLDGGRPAAGKTGTSSDNKDAWFVGFTPQLSTAVWLGYAEPKTIRVDGVEVTGGGLSSRIWKRYMDSALQGEPVLQFPPKADVGRTATVPQSPAPRAPSSPLPRRSSSSAPSPSPSEWSPSPLSSPLPLPSPSVTGPAPAPTRPSFQPGPSRSPRRSPEPSRTPSPAPTQPSASGSPTA